MKHPFDDIAEADLTRLGTEEWPGPASYRTDAPEWGEPDLSLLGTGRRSVPAYPLDVLGPWADWVQAKAREASAPPDYCATALLAAAGAAIANVRWPLAGAGWSEPPILWCAAVGAPSSGKSPAIDAALGLVRHAEELMAQDFDAVQLDYLTRKETSEARLSAWRDEVKAAAKAGEASPPMPSEAIAPVAPVRPRIRVSDVTTEKLAVLAAGLPRGLLMVRDELVGWLAGLDRYNGGGSDRALWIEAYGGRSHTVDRVKLVQAITIPHLSVGLCGGTQPERLNVILDSPDDGLASRLLWAWPDAPPRFKLSRERYDDTVMREAFARLAQLPMAQDEDGQLCPMRLRLAPQAEDLLEAFGQAMASREGEVSGLYGGTLGKARGHALRLSCVIDHLWWCANPSEAALTTIGEPAMRAATILLTDYHLPAAEKVFGDAAIPMPERRAMHLARHLRRTGLVDFNARTVRHELGGLVRDAANMAEACAVLEEANLIRPAFRRAGENRGRQARIYAVNPVVARRS